jgi:hypothetical protein
VTDTSVIFGQIPPLAASANKSPERYTLLGSNEYFKINVSLAIGEVTDGSCSAELEVSIRVGGFIT